MPAAAEMVPGEPLRCYDKTWVEPTYKTRKVKVAEGHEKYVAEGRKLILVKYAPLYKVEKVLVKEGHYELREAKCKGKNARKVKR